MKVTTPKTFWKPKCGSCNSRNTKRITSAKSVWISNPLVKSTKVTGLVLPTSGLLGHILQKRFFGTDELRKAEQFVTGSPVSRISKLELEELVKQHKSLFPSHEEPEQEFSMDDLEIHLDAAFNTGKEATFSDVLSPLQSHSQRKLRDKLSSVPESVPYYLIDVRDDHEIVTTGAIETSIPFPFGVFQEFFNMKPEEFEAAFFLPYPDQMSLLILYCHNGARATEVYRMLSLKGYHNVRLYHGGASEWFNLPLQIPKEKKQADKPVFSTTYTISDSKIVE